MITDPIPQLKELWKAAFADTEEAIDTFFSIAYSPDRCRYLTQDGKIVCALYWFDAQYHGYKLAYLYAVATLPAYRGKGLASRLIEQTHHHLKDLGYAGSVLKPAEGLFPFYEKLGYITSGYIRRFSAVSGDRPIPLNVLSSAEYAAARRKYLPADGMIQEGATLDYLESYAVFYEAENALVCVVREESVILEYLGDSNAAAGGLAALQIPSAVLPGPGNELPYAMFHALVPCPIPGYLGIALE